MDGIKNKDVNLVSGQSDERRPYQTPTLRALGSVQSVVQSGPSGQLDQGPVNSTSS
jgi:hypothetical protein